MKNVNGFTILVVNAQQRMIINANGFLMAVASEHNKVIQIKIPYSKNDLKVLSEEFKGYDIKERQTDSFTVEMWTNDGYTHIH